MNLRAPAAPNHKGKHTGHRKVSEVSAGSPPPRWTGRQRLFLAAICLAGFLRGAYWALTLPIWHPIDEAAHFAYAASIGSGDGIPTVGRDLVPPDVFRIAKQHPSQAIVPFSPNDQELWGTSGRQYEGIQPPLYYGLVGAIYALWGKPSAGLVLTMRLVTVALGVAALLLTALAAGRLFPDRPAVRLGAPALLAAIPAAGGYSAYITNDGATLTAAAAILWASAGLLRKKPTIKQSVTAGIVAGAGFLTRNSLVLLVLMAAVMLFRSCLANGVTRMRTAKLLAVMGAGFGALALPWIAWTRLAYKGTSITDEFADLVRPIAGTQARTVAGFLRHVSESANGWLDFLWPYPPPTSFFFAAAALVLVALSAGLIAAYRR
ncbi:MAG: DUF2142 domain-containing protein, partial [Actinomycetota bacterium]